MTSILTPKQIQNLQDENAMLTQRCEAMTIAWKDKAREARELSRAVLARDLLLDECISWLELLTNLPHYEKKGVSLERKIEGDCENLLKRIKATPSIGRRADPREIIEG